MEDLDRMLIERACGRLVTRYCHFVDHGEAARIAELFTDDGVWASAQNTLTGREEIERGFQVRQANTGRTSRHVCCNELIEVLDADRAEGVVYITLYRHDGEPGRGPSPSSVPAVVGEYRDAFARTPDGWRFQRRDFIASFVAPA